MPTSSPRDPLRGRQAPAPPPEPPTDAELKAAGLDLYATPKQNANCGQSAATQHETNSAWNRQHYEGYQNAVKNAEAQGSNPPPTIEPPRLDGVFDPKKPYYRLEDRRALEIICKNGKESVDPPDTWNWSQVW